MLCSRLCSGLLHGPSLPGRPTPCKLSHYLTPSPPSVCPPQSSVCLNSIAAGSPTLKPPLQRGTRIKQAIRPLSLTSLQGGIFSLRITFSGRRRQLPAASSSCMVSGEKQGPSTGTLPAQQLGLCACHDGRIMRFCACTAAGAVLCPARFMAAGPLGSLLAQQLGVCCTQVASCPAAQWLQLQHTVCTADRY